MKKVLITLVSAALAFGIGLAPASAVDREACNGGTAKVGHSLGVSNYGIGKIANVCHS